MGIEANCKFCGGTQKFPQNSCEHCGAHQTPSESGELTGEGYAQAITPVLKDARRSRVILTGLSLVFAFLVGIFWQRAQTPEQPSIVTAESLDYSSAPGLDETYKKKAMLAAAMIDTNSAVSYTHLTLPTKA